MIKIAPTYTQSTWVFLVFLCLSVRFSSSLDNADTAAAPNLRSPQMAVAFSAGSTATDPLQDGSVVATLRHLSSNGSSNEERHPDNDVDEVESMPPTISPAPKTDPPTEPPTTPPPTPVSTQAPTSAPTTSRRTSPLGGFFVDITKTHPGASIAGLFVLPVLAVAAALWVVNQNKKTATSKALVDQMLQDATAPEIVVTPTESAEVEMITSTRFGASQTIIEVPSVDRLSTEYVVMGGFNV